MSDLTEWAVADHTATDHNRRMDAEPDRRRRAYHTELWTWSNLPLGDQEQLARSMLVSLRKGGADAELMSRTVTEWKPAP